MVNEKNETSNSRQKPGRETHIRETDPLEHYRQKLARVALDEMYQFVAILDAEGTLLEVNRAALVGAGLKLSDVEGKPFWECYWWAVSKEIQETLKASIVRAAKGEFIRYDVEIYGRAAGKETIIIDFSMIPVRDETGQVVYLVPEGRDITEKKAYEREIAQKNADLQALLERVRELDEIKTQFFANVSHELRTPLALILGPAERLMREEGVTTRQEAAQLIARNARILLKHVDDLLDISKFEAGKLTITLQDTEVASLVRLIASNFEIVANERKIDYLVLAGEAYVCAVDPEKIQRVLMNLLANAFKFAPVGGTIRCMLQQVKKDLILSIEDSGPGVKPELRQAIFERFRQGEGGTNRQFGGTGLGLAIAKEFVEMHKGKLQVFDSPLGGARFQVTLPTSRLHVSEKAPSFPSQQLLSGEVLEGLLEELHPLPTPSAPHETVQSQTSTKRTIVLVEDNIDMHTFLAQMLSSDYHVISAFDGQEGLQKALEARPTLIITDIMMPKVSGVQMIARIRQHPELLNTPIVILSAKADEELKVKLLQEGAQDFVTKPFSEHDLLVRVRNVIERKRAEERLRMLAAIVESSDDAILSKDLEGIVTSWNPAAARIYGYTAEEIVGQPVTRLFAPGHQDEFRQIMARIRRGERVDHYETRRMRKDGTLLTMSITVSPIKDEAGVITGASTIARDMTAQKQLEAKSQRLFASNLIGIFVADESGTVLEVNEAFLELVGYTRAEWQAGMMPHKALAAEAAPFLSPEMLKAVQATGGFGPQETLLWRKSGNPLPALVAMTCIEEMESCIGFVLDISERKALDQRKDAFISMASHELKTPVTSLKGFLSLLHRLLAQQDDAKARHYLARMDAQIDKLTALINDLLDLSKMQTGHLVYREECFEMDGLVQEIIENIQETTQTHQLRLEGQTQAQVYGDRDRLGQVLINLLTNAIKYSPQADTVRVRLATQEKQILVSVQDFGPGIAKEHHFKIFERFYQVTGPEENTYPGLGIGLYICSDIVKRHGGQIWVESQKGEGSIFHVSLPLFASGKRSAFMEQGQARMERRDAE